MNNSQYYHFLISEGYNSEQINKFEQYAVNAENGVISHNKAYKMACKAGFDNIEGESNKGFGDWMETAQEAGWIDQGLGVLGNLVSKIGNNKRRIPQYDLPPPPPPKKDNTAIYLLSGVAVVGIGLTIYLLTRKK